MIKKYTRRICDSCGEEEDHSDEPVFGPPHFGSWLKVSYTSLKDIGSSLTTKDFCCTGCSIDFLSEKLKGSDQAKPREKLLSSPKMRV